MRSWPAEGMDGWMAGWRGCARRGQSVEWPSEMDFSQLQVCTEMKPNVSLPQRKRCKGREGERGKKRRGRGRGGVGPRRFPDLQLWQSCGLPGRGGVWRQPRDKHEIRGVSRLLKGALFSLIHRSRCCWRGVRESELAVFRCSRWVEKTSKRFLWVPP